MSYATGKVNEIVVNLDLMDRFRTNADDAYNEGNTFLVGINSNAADRIEQGLGESPSMAKVRAALLLLEDVTDQSMQRELRGPIADLWSTFRAVQNGSL